MTNIRIPTVLCSLLFLGTSLLLSNERDAVFQKEVDELFPTLVETRRHIHANPELSNQEVETSAYVAKRLTELGLEVQTGVAKHGVVALLKGTAGESDRCVAIRADMDALPITEPDNKPFHSRNAGVMHACGHDVHTTVGLGVAELLSKHRDKIQGTVKFLFQPAEESMPLGYTEEWGAKLMVTEGAMANPKPEAVFGLHCRPTITARAAKADGPKYLTAGQLAYAIGPDSANSDNFEILIKGKMSHGSAPHGGVDAIVVAAEAISSLQTIRSRRTDSREPVVLSIGTIDGGKRHNIIADLVTLTGTLRTYDADLRDNIIEMMHQILGGVTAAHGASYELDFRKGYPSILNDADLAKVTLPTFERLFGSENVIEMIPGMGGEDFSYFAQVVPGFYFRLGVSNPEDGITGEIHTPSFDVDENCLKTGVLAMSSAICDFLDRGK